MRRHCWGTRLGMELTMAFITKAAPKKETQGLSTNLDSDTKTELEAYVEFIGRPTGEVVNDILVAVSSNRTRNLPSGRAINQPGAQASAKPTGRARLKPCPRHSWRKGLRPLM